jgi:hypothetical protein
MGCNFGQEVMNSSTWCVSQLLPKTQKSNNTPLNLKKECKKNKMKRNKIKNCKRK